MTWLDNDRGVTIIAAIFIIVVLGFMGVMFLTMVNTGSLTAVNDLQSAQALYVAEGGLESAVTSLNTSTLGNRIACGNVTGNANLTIEPLGQGQFTVTGASVYSAAATTLNGAINNAATTINVNSTGGYAQYGRIMIDRELIDYFGTAGGNTFLNAVRGRDGTTASAHAIGANVGQDQCTITSTGGVPAIASPTTQRQVTEGVQLQEGWAVGAGGLPNNNINGAFCTSAANCWAVGAGGVILHWDGTFWDQAVSPTVRALNEVNCVNADPTNCWAVGVSDLTRPTILRWNTNCNGVGTTGIWNDCTSAPYDPAKNVNLNSVDMISSTDGWAVGMRDGTRATAFRWNTPCAGGAGTGVWNDCTAASVPARNQDLNSVFMISATDGWAVGTNDGTRATAFRWKTSCAGVVGADVWNDCTVASVPARNQDLSSVFMISATDGWAVGNNDGTRATAFRWNTPCAGGAGTGVWNNCSTAVYVPARNQNLTSVFMISAADGWAVGNSDGTRPTAFRWNTNCNGAGTTGIWNNCSALPYVPNVNQNLNAVVCSAANDCWAFGNNGTILHWNGTAWALQLQATASLLRWNGITWTDISGGLPASVTNLNSVSMLSYADVWSAGASTNPGTNKATLLRWNGTSWTNMAASVPPTATQNLNSIFMVSSTDGFAVGNNLAAVCGLAAGQPEILRWNGAAWNCVVPPTVPTLTGNYVTDLTAVVMLDTNNDGIADDGWAFGNNQYSTQLRWNIPCLGGAATGTWSDCSAYNWVTQGFNAVSMVTSTYGWAVGDLGTNVAGACNYVGGVALPALSYLNNTTGNWVCPAAGTWPATHVNLNGVFMISFTDGWAVGASNGTRPAVFRWDTPCGGGALTGVWNDCTSAAFVPAINQQLNSVYCVDANDCWAVGNAGLILHWGGSPPWAQVQAGLTAQNLQEVYIIGPEQRPQAAWQEVVK